MPAPAGQIVYRLAERADWARAEASGVYDGSADDLRDGFIHLSTAAQLPGTAAKHYRGRFDLVLIAFDTASLGDALRWEVSRGGALFPHLHAKLAIKDALWVRPVRTGPDGVPLVEALL